MWILLALQFLFLIGYVAGSVAFPKPLSPEEEEECLRKMRQGDREARDELIERNMRLVAHIVRKYSSQGKCGSWETDDLISVGSIGLMKGISTYREDKCTRLSTYLARCIENEILMLLRSDKKIKNEVSLQDPIGQDGEGNTLTLMDVYLLSNVVASQAVHEAYGGVVPELASRAHQQNIGLPSVSRRMISLQAVSEAASSG